MPHVSVFVVPALQPRERADAMQDKRRVSGTVLVIDDDGDMRRLLKDFLENDGHRIVEAANGTEAIGLLDSEPIDAVILDKEMPGMNGFDVLAFLQREHPGLPVIFITAFGGPEVAEESLHRGALHYVEKPFRIGSIVETVQIVLCSPR